MTASLCILSGLQFYRSAKDSFGYSLIMRVAPIALLGGLWVSRAMSLGTLVKVGLVVLSFLGIGEQNIVQPSRKKPISDGRNNQNETSLDRADEEITLLPDGVNHKRSSFSSVSVEEQQGGDPTKLSNPVVSLLEAALPLGSTAGGAGQSQDAKDLAKSDVVASLLQKIRGEGQLLCAIEPNTAVTFEKQYIGLFPVSCASYVPGSEPQGDMDGLIQEIRKRLSQSKREGEEILLYYEIEMAIRKVMDTHKIGLWPIATLGGFVLELLREVKTKPLINVSYDRCAQILYMTSRMILDFSDEGLYPVLKECYNIYRNMPEEVRYKGESYLGAWMNIVFCLPPSGARDKFCRSFVEQDCATLRNPRIKCMVSHHLLAWALITKQEVLYPMCKKQICDAIVALPSSHQGGGFTQLDEINLAFVESKPWVDPVKNFINSASYSSNPAKASYQLLMLLIRQYESIRGRSVSALMQPLSLKIRELSFGQGLLDRCLNLLCLFTLVGYRDEAEWRKLIEQITCLDTPNKADYILQCGQIICSANNLALTTQNNLLQCLYRSSPETHKEILKGTLTIAGFDHRTLSDAAASGRRK